MQTIGAPEQNPVSDRDALTSATLSRGRLRKLAFRGSASTIGVQGLKLIVGFGSTAILARLLVPEDFGLIAMVAPVVAFATLIQDLGLSQAAIQRQVLTSGQGNFLFWINVAVGALLFLALAAAAPAIGLFYGRPQLVPVVIALAFLAFLGSLGAQHRALLNREMRFQRLAALDGVSVLVGTGAGILAAFAWRSYWALVVLQAATAASALVLAWTLSGWRPAWPRRVGAARELMGFGAGVTLFNITNFLGRNADNVLLGRFWGDHQLGLYDRAYKLLLFPITNVVWPLGRVMLPILARLRDDPPRYRGAYLDMTILLGAMLMPGIVALALNAEVIVAILLGPKWKGSVPIFVYLSLAALHQPTSVTAGWLFLSQGRSADLARVGVISAVLNVAAFVIGLRWGAIGVAASYSAVYSVLIVPLIWVLAARKGIVKLNAILATLGPLYLAAGAGGALSWFGLREVVSAPGLRTVLSVFVVYATAFSILLLFPRSRDRLLRFSRTGLAGGLGFRQN